eukprot:COSAG01_NODE_62947_length_282_cov_0.803279_1_plen_21_part_10
MPGLFWPSAIISGGGGIGIAG